MESGNMRVQSSTLNQYNTNYCEKSSKAAQTNEKTSANNVDSYVPSIDTGTSGTYSKTSTSKYISQSLMDTINSDMSKVRGIGDTYYCGGVSFKESQIPKVDVSRFSEKKAVNNILDFGKNSYFKYTAGNGKQYGLFTMNGAIGTIFTDVLRGEPYSKERERFAGFWNFLMQRDPVYLGLQYSNDEARKYLDEAGIKNGFFTVKMGDREFTHFYTNSKNTGPVKAKYKYDNLYNEFTSAGNILNKYEPGSIFKINGKEYTLSENHTLDIEYGEDIYNMEFPSNYKFGQKIE